MGTEFPLKVKLHINCSFTHSILFKCIHQEWPIHWLNCASVHPFIYWSCKHSRPTLRTGFWGWIPGREPPPPTFLHQLASLSRLCVIGSLGHHPWSTPKASKLGEFPLLPLNCLGDGAVPRCRELWKVPAPREAVGQHGAGSGLVRQSLAAESQPPGTPFSLEPTRISQF